MIENKQASEDYINWRNSTSFLYDSLIAHGLVWPSLTVQWVPDEQKYI